MKRAHKDMTGRTVSGALLALLVGCSGGGEPQAGTRHLDPRLADGDSSAERLLAKSQVVRAWDFEVGQHADWTPTKVTFEDRFLRAWDLDAAAAPIDASAVNGVGWTARLGRATRARVEWRRATDPEGSWPAECAAELSVAADPEGEREVRLELGTHATWVGEIVALRVMPDGLTGAPVELVHVELDQRGFWGGFEPLGEGEGAAASDGGLVCLNNSGRRTWPTDFGVPLSVTAEVPAGGRLVFDVALGPAHRDSLERVHLAVDIADAGTDPLGPAGWERLWYRTVVPRLAPVETLWHAFGVDLAEHAGESVSLRLRAWSGHGKDDVAAGLDGTLEEAAVLWGSPEVLGDPGGAPLPNIVLVTLDTTRQDLGGAPTPYFDELKAGGMTFTNSLSVGNVTQPSHASVLTGSFPMDHGVHDNFALLAGANSTLAERLRKLGYHTAAAVSQRYLGAGAGFGQGFDEFLQASPDAATDGGETIRALRSRVLEWQSVAPERPLFIWLHLFDAHTPYTAPSGFAATFVERYGSAPKKLLPQGSPGTLPVVDELPETLSFLAGSNSLAYARHLYAVEVSYTDGLVENFASGLAEAGLLGRTAFFVTADHGESLGEHQSYFTHQGILAETIEVPLFMRIPGGPAGLKLDEPASGIDVAPTILRYAAAGRSVDLRGLRGRDLLAGHVTGDVGVPAEASRPRFFEHANQKQLGVRRGKWQLVVTRADDMRLGIEVVTDAAGRKLPREKPVPPGAQLFDLEGDPGMLEDVSAAHAAEVTELSNLLKAWQASAWDLSSGANTERETTPAERGEMGKLGYGE
jgi:arylsulfatase A-like enzyme